MSSITPPIHPQSGHLGVAMWALDSGCRLPITSICSSVQLGVLCAVGVVSLGVMAKGDTAENQ